MAAASCKYPISWQFANRNSRSSFSPRSGEESPTHQKNETQRAIGDRPTNIHERDSELVGAVIDRPQTVQEPKGRNEESPAYQKTKPNGRSVIAPTNIQKRNSELVGAVIDRPQAVQELEESPAHQKAQA